MVYYKILFYESSSGFGGSANALANLVNNLDRKKFSPIVVIKNYGSKIKKIENTRIIKLKNYDEPEKLSTISFLFFFIRRIIPEVIKMYFIIKKYKINLVHTNTNIITGLPCLFATKLANIPCVCHARGTRTLLKRHKIFAKWVDKFIVLNKTAYQIYRKYISEKKLVMIYDGIDLEKQSTVDSPQSTDRSRIKEEFGLDSYPVVGIIGRIVRGKGHKEFILSAKEVLKVRPEVRFVIVGDSKGDDNGYYKEIKELVKKEKLEKNIIFTGWRDDLENVINDLDLIVQPYTSPEGLPNIIIEAMAHGKPVISTNLPGPSEIIINNETGFLVKPGNIKVISEKIIYLLEHPHIMQTMGEKGKERVKQTFNITNTVTKLEKIYLSLTEER